MQAKELERLRARSLVARVLTAIVLAWSATAASSSHAQTAIEKATALREAGQFDEALGVLRAERAEIERVDKDDWPRLLPVDDLTTEILIDQGAVEAAETLLTKNIALRQRLVDTGLQRYGVELGTSLLVRVRLLTVAKRLPDAVAAARQALTVCDRAVGPQSREAEQARQALTTAVDALDAFLGPDDEATLAARDGAATTFASLGLFANAIEQRRRILASLMASGAKETDVAGATERLCRLMMLAGRADEAIPILKKSLVATPSVSAPITVAGTRLLGQLSLAADQLTAADASFKAVLEATRATERVPTCASSGDRCRRILIASRRGIPATSPDELGQELKILAKPTPEERISAADGLAVAGGILLSRGEAAAAVEQLARALGMAAALKPPAPELVAELTARLVAAHLAAGDPTAALKIGEPAVAVAERELGAGDARVSFLRVLLADALRRSDQVKKAEAMIDEALTRDLPRPDCGWEEAVVSICDRLATGDGRAELRDRYVAARARQFGDEHPHVGMAWSLFGAARLAAADWSSAVDYLSRAIAVQQATLGVEHPEVAATMALLAHAERASGNPAQAAETAARAVAAWERIAGPNHPGTLAAADVLVSARLQAGDMTGVEELLTRLSDAESNSDPVLRAGHLVRLAGITIRKDKAAAQAHLKTAMTLPCWEPDAVSRAADRQRLAFTAARAAFIYKLLGEPTASEDSLRKARSLALKAENSRQLLEQLEKLAADGVDPAAVSR
jgi:tetratricopeptide (TPR) repeat protein